MCFPFCICPPGKLISWSIQFFCVDLMYNRFHSVNTVQSGRVQQMLSARCDLTFYSSKWGQEEMLFQQSITAHQRAHHVEASFSVFAPEANFLSLTDSGSHFTTVAPAALIFSLLLISRLLLQLLQYLGKSRHCSLSSGQDTCTLMKRDHCCFNLDDCLRTSWISPEAVQIIMFRSSLGSRASSAALSSRQEL